MKIGIDEKNRGLLIVVRYFMFGLICRGDHLEYTCLLVAPGWFTLTWGKRFW